MALYAAPVPHKKIVKYLAENPGLIVLALKGLRSDISRVRLLLRLVELVEADLVRQTATYRSREIVSLFGSDSDNCRSVSVARGAATKAAKRELMLKALQGVKGDLKGIFNV
jgi:hypothetical protein